MDGNANDADLSGKVTALSRLNDALDSDVEAPTGTAPAPRPFRLKSQTKRLQSAKFAAAVVRRCDICNEPLTNRTLRIDHDHQTGKARGFLCNACNTGLGMFEDNPNILRNAVRYLTHHREDGLTGYERRLLRESAKTQPQRFQKKLDPFSTRATSDDLKVRIGLTWHTHPNGKRRRCLPTCRHFAQHAT